MQQLAGHSCQHNQHLQLTTGEVSYVLQANPDGFSLVQAASTLSCPHVAVTANIPDDSY
jgi:hypothetical protein